MPTTCDKCTKYKLGFNSDHNLTPFDYIEGNPNSKVWIIGLNPAMPVGYPIIKSADELFVFKPVERYHKDFQKVSKVLFDNWQSDKSEVAHTDLVKCPSPSFPFSTDLDGKQVMVDTTYIIDNCVNEYLVKQLETYKPQVIICNGSPVCSQIIRLFPPKTNEPLNTLTSYKATVVFNETEHSFWIVLSGFIGRIDDRNKRRLGKEIESILVQENIAL